MFLEQLRWPWLSVTAMMWCLGVTPAFAREIPTHPKVDPHEVDGSALGGPVDLTQNWLLRMGDDPAYAKQRFDDSQWMVIDAGQTLASYGLKDVDVVWYRTHVSIPPAEQKMQLLVRFFSGSFEVFINGVKLGNSGPHPEHGALEASNDLHFNIPDELIATGEVTVALRGEVGRASAGGTRPGGLIPWSAVMLGPASEIANETSLAFFRSYTSDVTNILIEVLVPLIALVLALTLPKEREYVALAVSGTASVLAGGFSLWRQLHNIPTTDLTIFIDSALTATATISLLEFVRRTLGLPMRRWYAGYLFLVAFMILVVLTAANHVSTLGGGALPGPIVALNLFLAIVLLPFDIGIPVLLLWAWKKLRKPDALLLFVPFVLRSIVTYWQIAVTVLYDLHWRSDPALPSVPVDALFVKWNEVANLLFTLSLLVFLMLRTVRIARSRAAMASDLQAVQSVQEILLARASHDTPGFHVEHVYHPAQEVGGDFFLVSPGPDGSVTAIVGDVSGKGLVAAMRVSMILGVLRREEQRQPDAIMRGLNDALMLQGEMGFTTACCVRIESDGRYTVANAGQISPYIEGVEVDTPHALPLGLMADQEFEQVEGWLPAGKTMVLMSDGVVEARAANGELYGFDRLGALTRMNAEDIADVARRFGQEDDITVLTLERLAQRVAKEVSPAMLPLPA